MNHEAIINRKDIRLTRARIDCRWIRLHNFVDFKGNRCTEQYAECTNPVKTHGMVSIDITEEGNPLQWEVSCRKCNCYESECQLELF